MLSFLLGLLVVFGAKGISTPAASTAHMPANILSHEVEAASQVASSSLLATGQKVHHQVIKVIDGDTVTIRMNGNDETLRLIGINTPETVDPRRPVQCFGKESSSEMKRLLSGGYVDIETDISQGERDKYGRLLAYVILPDGTNVNHALIANGFAYEYTYTLPYKYQAEFKAAQQSAEKSQKGLWAPGACVAPSPSAKSPVPVRAPVPTPSTYVCTSNMYNCSSFKTHAEAQAAFEACGGSANDVHRLDGDKDGMVCESLP